MISDDEHNYVIAILPFIFFPTVTLISIEYTQDGRLV